MLALLLILSPLLVLLLAGARAAILFWPFMVALGALHSYVSWVPPLGWEASFLTVLVVSLLIPTDATGQE